MTLSRRHLLAGLGVAAAVPLAGCMSAQPVLAADLPPLTAALREGGHVVYFRHAATQWSGIDRIEWPRERQRLLSDEGVAQAEAIGAAWRAAGVPVGEVWASPFARCADHARISFGRAREDMRLIGLLSDDTGRPERVAFLRGRVTDPPAPGTNRVIVSHRQTSPRSQALRWPKARASCCDPTGLAPSISSTRGCPMGGRPDLRRSGHWELRYGIELEPIGAAGHNPVRPVIRASADKG